MYSHYPDFHGHELVTSRQDSVAGLNAIIAIHNSNLGPAIGGCRILGYADTDAAVTDVLRLSRGMTYKAAIARIPYGGGKAVIIADPRVQKTAALLHAMGEFVESLGGRYITSFDSGTTLDDVRTMAERTGFTAGTLREAGNASASTAHGVFHCMKAAARVRLGSDDLREVRVAVQGVGNVGRRLVEMLGEAGASVTLADSDSKLASEVAGQVGARQVEPEAIHRVEADVFAPCALGGILSAMTIGEMSARVIVGGANNQLAGPEDDQRLVGAGILYCPDYLANAGGIIDLHYQRSGWSPEAVKRHVESLAETFLQVAERSSATGLGTSAIADRIAEERFMAAGGDRA